MNDIKRADYYCTGCGLCVQGNEKSFIQRKGFNYPVIDKANLNLCKKVCPCFSDLKELYSDNNVWGNYKSIFLGYSTDEKIRHKASSGGAITSIALYLLETKLVDGVIHSVADDKRPWLTKTVCSKTSEEIKQGCGSRYTQSSPLKDFESYLEDGKKYAFIGKPCDVYSLNQYMRINHAIEDKIAVTISFFCAGQPSEPANLKLISELLQEDKGECVELNYRGNGWPGEASARSKSGRIGSMKYEKSWGKILGRDIKNICRYCMIGTGEPADISCGDAWKLTLDNKPSFEEGNGENVIFARTERGSSILLEAANKGYIQLKGFEDKVQNIRYIQPSQYDRKITMIAKLLGMKAFFKPTPQYNFGILFKLAKMSTLNRLFEVFRGTIGRIVRKRL